MAARDRHRGQQAAQARTNDYFVPKDGIDREVITADICRYLGNDALVRPGTYENPQTRAVQNGYFITAYRNLTTAMIADLKADSERWDAERRSTASRGQPSNGISTRDRNGIVKNSNTPLVEYRSSTTHQSRQYYGPSQQDTTGTAVPYAQPAAAAQQGLYDQSNMYQQQTYAQPAPGYAANPAYATQDSNYYVAGADYSVVEQPRQGARPVGTTQPTGAVPRTGAGQQYATANSSYQQQQPSSAAYYTSSTGQPGASAAQYATTQNPTDPFYGRAAVPGAYDTSQEVYDTRGYADTAAYSQPTPTSSTTQTSSSSQGGRRSENERDRDRDRHRRR